MVKTLPLCIAVVLSSYLNVFADSWMQATAFDSFSDSSNHVARVTPGSKATKARLEVYSINTGRRTLIWEVELSNPVSPTDVYISDNGKHVITFDNWGSVGYGDDVVAVYSDKGLLKKYPLESLFDRPSQDELMNNIDKLMKSSKDFDRVNALFSELHYLENRFSHSTSSRWWRKHSFAFFDSDAPIFSLWIDWDSRWIAWDMLTGNTLNVSVEQTKKWNQECRSEVLDRITKGTAHISEYEFLGKLKNTNDIGLIKAQLEDPEFSTGSTTSYQNDDPPVFTFTSESAKRKSADRILANLKEPRSADVDHDEAYTFLGSLKLQVTLPEPPMKGEGNIVVYLVEHGSGRKPDPQAVPKHYLFADLNYNYPYDIDRMADSKLIRTVNCEIRGITPGTYSVTALWDRQKPFEEPSPTFTASKGDVVSKRPAKITIVAGSVLEDVAIKCLDRVE